MYVICRVLRLFQYCPFQHPTVFINDICLLTIIRRKDKMTEDDRKHFILFFGNTFAVVFENKL